MPQTLEQRIEKALESGPLYAPLLGYVAGADSQAELRRALRRLEAEGRVERSGPSYRLTRGEDDNGSDDAPTRPNAFPRA